MSEDGKRLSKVIAAIDAANARDPNKIAVGGELQPAELVYGRRMSETLARMAPHASEPLRIAARGQHIERWTSPRASYAAGRVGYLKWRKDLQGFHARRIGEIMVAAGYDAGGVERVGALIRKERLKSDADAQMIEDVACVGSSSTTSPTSWPRPMRTSSPASYRRGRATRPASSPSPRPRRGYSNRAWHGCAPAAERDVATPIVNLSIDYQPDA